jgi:hypothetical protein
MSETVELDSLCGEHKLSGVDFSSERVERYGSFEDCSVMRFRLDGKVYTAVEDPSDGYRSCMDRIFVERCKINNSFSPVRVVVRKKPDHNYNRNDTLEMIDIKTGKTVLEVGTDAADDYYPSFVASFWPENMATNNQATPTDNIPPSPPPQE